MFEALALGSVPIVADFGGPGDIVIDEVGYRIPLTNENEMVSKIEFILGRLASDRRRGEEVPCAGSVRHAARPGGRGRSGSHESLLPP